MEVIPSLLRLLLRPASRISGQRSLKSSFASLQDRLVILAQNWGFPALDQDYQWVGQTQKEIPTECGTLKFQFYRMAKSIKVSQGTGLVLREPPAGHSTVSSVNAIEEAMIETPSLQPSSSSMATLTPDGLVQIVLANVSSLPGSDLDILRELTAKYAVPEEHTFALFHKIQ